MTTGAELRLRREALGWSRQQLVDKIKHDGGLITHSRLAAIELGRTPGPLEIDILERMLGLRKTDEEKAVAENHAVELPDDWDGEVKLTEWCGLTDGDLVKVEGELRATFHFNFYYRSATQEYVQVTGGRKGHMRIRCFKPDRIRTLKGKPVAPTQSNA